MEINEKIIECVRKHNCLWEPRNKHYKNAVLKARVWQAIGEELNESHESIKRKWKSMRDAYIKYKKQIKGTTGSGRKTINFMWAAQLSFLDSSISPRETESNIYGENGTPIMTDSDTSTPSPSTPSTPSTSSTNTNPDTDVTTQPLSPRSPRPFEPSATSRPANKKTAEADVDSIIIDFINKKKEKPRYDGIDYLFLSYAQTFKKLTTHKQAMLKVDLARLFSEAELNELASPQCPQYVQRLSPTYSMISETSDSYTYNTNHSENAANVTNTLFFDVVVKLSPFMTAA
ncbi:uncharacterized protein [Choristoneura fumiferana]|uniref:uncharacterized protein n=1 Tax=Choristoneura fumiferana TaxID=7141 RepID=UPI003D1561E7